MARKKKTRAEELDSLFGKIGTPDRDAYELDIAHIVTHFTMKIDVVNKELWGCVESPEYVKPGFAIAVQECDISTLIEQARLQIADFIANEGKDDEYWQTIKPNYIRFNLIYGIEALFFLYPELHISAIAKRAKINESLLRQYASSVKTPGDKQLAKIQKALHELGKELLSIKLTY